MLEGAFSDFVLTADVLTESGAIGSLSVLWLNESAPPADSRSLHVSIDNSRQWSAVPRTGSLTGVCCQFKSIAKDGEWFKLRISTQKGRARVFINDVCVADATGFAPRLSFP